MTTTQNNWTKPASMYDQILEALATSLDGMPTEGTERERQAWRNGARETTAVITQILFGRDPFPDGAEHSE